MLGVDMAEIKEIRQIGKYTYVVELDQEIWDSFAKVETNYYKVLAKDALEAYINAMKRMDYDLQRTG
jgi:hypothetical protein